jgi:hypothetical protein
MKLRLLYLFGGSGINILFSIGPYFIEEYEELNPG